ncbi:HAD-IIB family hydrolase [Acidisoma cellulosilytica]|uniref:HAD-IIB family hydrolase n=1 Tax=Acidisoma cellulosilyticum TaxID=2802395 RepID=A0A964E5R1_9PROT|nr:HAD-IIB family hydrolase [Acidisoma cellulosilyticum]MCB8882692.1 HAD-IIB family hydrolase [Acidisoma cellulosilyticum]
MYFLALATDYDGTLAHDGVVSAETIAALQRFRASGRRLILITGREIRDLKAAMPDLTLFDIIVAENGALLYDPKTGRERLLGTPPSPEFVARLREMKVAPLSVGRGVVATWQPHEATVLSVIHDLGLELQIVFNKGAVMVLPSGISKASGLKEALSDLGLSVHNTVGVGDAENDHSFLSVCGCAAAVSNALPHLKASADILLTQDHGAGVAELIDRIIRQDRDLAPVAKHGILIGVDAEGRETHLTPEDGLVLIVGPSGSGKSTLATTITEHMIDRGLSFCVMDPEGDYFELQHAVCVGSAASPPNMRNALKLQQDAGVNLVINSQALPLAARRKLFAQLVREATTLRARTGRPHWLVIDEAHEVLPADRQGEAPDWPGEAPNIILVTLYPEALDADVLKSVSTILAFGDNPARALSPFAAIAGLALPLPLPAPRQGDMLYWQPKAGKPAALLRPPPPRQQHRRHIGKYATGNVGAWHSFYFRGRQGQCNLTARNLYEFIDCADKIDDETWDYHLRSGHYSAWFRDVIRDDGLARDVGKVEQDHRLDARDSRRIVRKAIWRRYAAPCERFGSSLQDAATGSEQALYRE